MNDVVVSRSELERVAVQADDAAEIVAALDVAEPLSAVRTIMPGAGAGSEAASAGAFIDDISGSLSAALSHVAQSVRTAAENYNDTDQSASLSIQQVLEELGR